jgi:uncharacterized protein YcbK (DUF882 family)
MAQDNSPLILETAGVSLNRRSFLKLSGGAGISLLAAPTLFIPKSIQAATVGSSTMQHLSKKQDLFLSFYNRHTGESLKKCTFWVGGKYDPQALRAINKLFRDHRTGAVHNIDRNLLHILYKIQKKLETSEMFHLISGYRSPQSNKMLNIRSRGVAKRSLHLQGKAADIYVPGRSLRHVQAAAKSMRAGGVGRYTEFVHVDTGRVRYWGAA